MKNTKIKQTYLKYLEEHHHITESAIGLAKVELLRNDIEKAMTHLDKASDRLEEITVEYLPETTKMLEKLKGYRNDS